MCVVAGGDVGVAFCCVASTGQARRTSYGNLHTPRLFCNVVLFFLFFSGFWSTAQQQQQQRQQQGRSGLQEEEGCAAGLFFLSRCG
jgi:hypothetical protein